MTARFMRHRFYGESSMIMYRTDLMKKGWAENAKRTDLGGCEKSRPPQLTDKSNGIYGICLRGKAGWGENMAFLNRYV